MIGWKGVSNYSDYLFGEIIASLHCAAQHIEYVPDHSGYSEYNWRAHCGNIILHYSVENQDKYGRIFIIQPHWITV